MSPEMSLINNYRILFHSPLFLINMRITFQEFFSLLHIYIHSKQLINLKVLHSTLYYFFIYIKITYKYFSSKEIRIRSTTSGCLMTELKFFERRNDVREHLWQFIMLSVVDNATTLRKRNHKERNNTFKIVNTLTNIVMVW